MLNNLDLKSRMLVAFLFMGAIVLIVALIGWFGNGRLSQHIQTISNNTFPSTVALLRINGVKNEIEAEERLLISTRLNAEVRRSTVQAINDSWQEASQYFKDYEVIKRKTEELQLYQNLLRNWELWKQSSVEFERLHTQFLDTDILNPLQRQIELIRLNQADSPEFARAERALALIEQMLSYSLNEKAAAFQGVENSLNNLIQYNQQLTDSSRDEAFRDINQTSLSVLMGVLIGPLTALFFGIYFSNVIAKPLGHKIARVVNVAEKISGGDLTSQVDISSEQDEVGKLMTAFHAMTYNLNSLIRQVQQAGIQITTSTTEIAASGKELEAAVTQQVASTNEVVTTAREIATNSGHLVKTMEEVSHLSQSTAQAASDGQKDLFRMQETMRQLAESTRSISHKLSVISEKANNISSIVTTITKVADQTNLLSLNAAIEAEKAREYGLGFAVVAKEIRRLADQTAVATLDIESMVKEMQSAVSTGVMEMDKFTQEVRRSVQDVGGISSQLAQIIDQVQGLTPRFETVSEGMDAQSQGAQQISESMFQLKEAAMQTADALRETNRAIDQLNDAAHNLRRETSKFKVNV